MVTSELRRLRSTLTVSGTAVIAFGAWSAVKLVLLLVLDPASLLDVVVEGDSSAMTLATAVVVVFIAASMGIRLYVGRSARAEGRGERRSAAYVVVATLVAASDALSTALMFRAGDDVISLVSTVATSLVDITSLLALADLVVAAVRVRRLVPKAR